MDCPSCRALDIEPEVQGFLISCDRALDRLCLRNTDGIPRKFHSYIAGTYFDFEGDSVIAAMLDQIPIGRSRARHGDKEIDTIFGLSMGSLL